MSTLLESFGSDADRLAAAQHQKDENQRHIEESLEVARKYKAATSGAAVSNEVNIADMNTEVNESLAALRKFSLPDETVEQTAIRGRDSGVNDPLLKQAAQRAIAAQTTMAAELDGAEVVVAKAQAKKIQSRTDNMLQTRRNDIRNEARKVAQTEGIPLADAFQIVMMEIQVDGAEAVLPNFTKVRENAIREMEAEAAEAGDDS